MQEGEERWRSDSNPGQADTWLTSDGFLHNLCDDCFGCGGGRGGERRSAWEMRQSWSEMLVWKAEPAHMFTGRCCSAIPEFPTSVDQNEQKTKRLQTEVKTSARLWFCVMPVCTTRGQKEAAQLSVTSRGRGMWVWMLSGSLDKHSNSLNSAYSENFVVNSLLTFYTMYH